MSRTYLLIICLVFSLFWIFWLPGLRVANDYHLAQRSAQLEAAFPWSWRETNVADGLGENTTPLLWSQPILSFSGFLAKLSIPFALQEKLLGALVILIGLFSIDKLLKFLKISGQGRLVGSIFYVFNTFFLLLFDGGQLVLALAYACIPLAIFYFFSWINLGNLSNIIKLTIITLLISIFDIRILYILIIIFFTEFIYRLLINSTQDKFIPFKNYLLAMVFVSIFLLGFHAYWLLPAALSRLPQLPATYNRAAQIDFLSFSNIGHALFLQQPHWYKNIFGRIVSLRIEFILIPFFIFLAPILRKKDKNVGFWLTIAVLGIFLTKGSQEPLPQVYTWLFTHIPGFSLFRDPAKFFFLIGLSYSVLLGFLVQGVTSLRNKNFFLQRLLNWFPILVIIYLIWLIRPVYLGQMTGLLSWPVFEKEFALLSDRFERDDNFSRIFWIPAVSPLGYTTVLHPAVEASGLASRRPFAIGTIGTYETFNFLRESSYMGEIFDVAGIGYIAYPYLDPRRDNLHPDNIKYFYTFLDQLSERSWLTRIENSSIPLLKTPEHQDRFFITPNTWWVIGSDSIYNEATKSANLKLSKNALIFAEEFPGLSKKISGLPGAKIVLNHKTDLDLAASFIDSLNLIFPAKNLSFQPDQSGWWKREAVDLVWWRSLMQEKYGIVAQDFDLGGGWAVGEKDLKLKIKSEKFKKDKVLLARVMESSRSGELKFYQGNQEIGKVTTNIKGDANVRWFEVDQLKSNQELTVVSKGDINVVNALAVLDENEWLGYKKIAREYIDQGRIVQFNEKNTASVEGSVTYQRINPTKYIVHISGLTRPAFLVFSQNFDGFWKLEGQSPIPVYSLLNGFKIDRDGDYIIEFEPQKYVYPGLIIAGVTIAILFMLLFKSTQSPNSKL